MRPFIGSKRGLARSREPSYAIARLRGENPRCEFEGGPDQSVGRKSRFRDNLDLESLSCIVYLPVSANDNENSSVPPPPRDSVCESRRRYRCEGGGGSGVFKLNTAACTKRILLEGLDRSG